MKRYLLTIFALFALLLTGCANLNEVAYLSDAPRDSATTILHYYTSTIHPGDQLYIYVSSGTPESVIPFNEETNRHALQLSDNQIAARQLQQTKDANTALISKLSSLGSGLSSSTAVGYPVQQDGTILFPVLGRIDAAGLTDASLALHLQQRLINEGYVTDPLVTIRRLNFRVAVIGEVAVPQEIHVQGDRLTILEALAICGDLTMDGMRTNVGILREVEGRATLGRIDLTSRQLFDSPYYYLQPNDIVYIEPTRHKKQTAIHDDVFRQDFSSYVGIGTSVIRAANMIWNSYSRQQRRQ